jgi:tetratricopeptide (TPR) repeat protein
VPIDRDATLKQAEKLLRQGKLDGAIAEYVRLVHEQPRDWTSINALGDLYVRAGSVGEAVAQFSRIADHMFAEGFLPRAAALYKKALKVAPDHEHTLLRLSEIAAGQGLLADARAYLRQLGRVRRERGDTRGADECLVRLALLDEADVDTRLQGARAAAAIGDARQAAALFKDAAADLSVHGRRAEALDALTDAAALDPQDQDLRRTLAREYVDAGDVERARPFLTADSAGADPELLLALGRRELEAGHEPEARAVLTRFIALAPSRWGSLLDLAVDLARAGAAEPAFVCAAIVVDDALLGGEWSRAIDALRHVLRHAAHIPALITLVELAVDAGRDDVMQEAQIQLADAYLAAGQGAEARVIAEDLVARDPRSDAHVDRLRRALALLGVSDAESIVNRYRESAGGLDESLDLAETLELDAALRDLDERLDLDVTVQTLDTSHPVEERDAPIELDLLEIDLSDLLAAIEPAGGAPSPAPNGDETSPPPPDLESVFEQMRSRATRSQATEEYERALRYLEQGRRADAFVDLKAAARLPLYRFRAAARLGRLCVAQGDPLEGIEWLERAALAPAPTAEEGWSVLYDLAIALEQIGETARAMAVLIEIDADAPAFRDVRARIEQLARVQAARP